MTKENKFEFQAEVSQLLQLLTHSIYSNKEIFLRELIANANDAIDKAKMRSLTDPDYLGDDVDFKIIVDINSDKKTLIITDNGIGMSKKEIIENLGTIAKSGTKDFIEKLKENQNANNLIGQFGVGFYSSFMVSDKIEVESKSSDVKKGVKWTSEGKGNFEISESSKKTRGTSVRLFINEGSEEFLEENNIKGLISKYSNYIPIPIMMKEPEDENDKTKIRQYNQINETKSIWTKNKSEVKEEEYKKFYNSVSMDFQDPLGYVHLNIEGLINYNALLYIPHKTSMFGVSGPEEDYGPKLYVQNVMILERTKNLLPVWLRFVKGVVETRDLPLNISRELLQSNEVLAKIRSSITKQIVNKLISINKEFPDKYDEFMESYGKVLKEGVYYDNENRELVASAIKFYSVEKKKLISLDYYIENFQKDQQEIYYITGSSRQILENSPYLEIFKKKNFDVLLLTDPIDEYVIGMMPEYKSKKLRSAASSDINLNSEDNAQKDNKSEKKSSKDEDNKDFLTLVKNIIGNQKIEEVKFTDRLVDTVGVLVSKDGGMSAQMEQMMKAMNQAIPENKRILELNSSHKIVEAMIQEHQNDPKSEKLNDMVKFIYDQATMNEGREVEDTKAFMDRLNKFAGKFMGLDES